MARPLTLPESIHVRLPKGALAIIDATAKDNDTTAQEAVRMAILAAFGIPLPRAKEKA